MSKNDNAGGQAQEAFAPFVDTQRRMNDRKTLQDFVNQIQQNKEAYTLFQEQCERRGMMQPSPQRKFQHQYYQDYIRPQIESRNDLHHAPSKSMMDGGKSGNLTGRGRNASAVSRNGNGGSFLPLKDLLKRNHDDRVQDYLTKMNEESTEDLLNPSAKPSQAQGDATKKQKQIIAEVKNLQRQQEGAQDTKGKMATMRVDMFDASIGGKQMSRSNAKMAQSQRDTNNQTLVGTQSNLKDMLLGDKQPVKKISKRKVSLKKTYQMNLSEIFEKNAVQSKRDHFFADVIVVPGVPETGPKDGYSHVKSHMGRMEQARELKMKNNPYRKQTIQSPKTSTLPDLSASKYVSMQQQNASQRGNGNSSPSRGANIKSSGAQIFQGTRVIEEEKNINRQKTQHAGHEDVKTDGQNSEMGHKDGDEVTSEGGGSIAGNTERKVKKNKNNKIQKINEKYRIDVKGPFAKYFKNTICTDQRLNKASLNQFLAKRYKNELAKSITNLMGEFLNYTQPNINLSDFANGVDLLFNKSEEDLRRFAFKIYDANGDNKLSEQDMFDLLRWSGANKDQQVEIEKLRPTDRFDLFDDVFSQDYIKISAAIKNKKTKTGLSHEETMARKLEKLSKPMNLQPKGIGIETKFGLNKAKGLASKPSAGLRNSTSISEQDNGLDKTQNLNIKAQDGDQKKTNGVQLSKKQDQTIDMVYESAKAKIKTQLAQKIPKDQQKDKDSKQVDKNLHQYYHHEAEDKTFALTEDEFVNIGWDREWPRIIQDLSYLFSNDKKLLKGTRIYEKDEDDLNKKTKKNDEEIDEEKKYNGFKADDYNQIKNRVMIFPNALFFAANAFLVLQGQQSMVYDKVVLPGEKAKGTGQEKAQLRKCNTLQDVLKFQEVSTFNFDGPDSQLYVRELFLTEEMIVTNFHLVFGENCPFFGKILYLYMSRGFDRCKITFVRFLQCLYPFMNNEERNSHNKIAFQMLDIDKDNDLNILNLVHLHKNMEPDSRIGNEIFSLIEYYINNTLTKKSSGNQSTNVGINYDAFSKIIKKCAIIDEIREVIFGCALVGANMNQGDLVVAHSSCFKKDPLFKFEKGHIFDTIYETIEEDVSMGQRGFQRNLEALLGQILNNPKKTTKGNKGIKKEETQNEANEDEKTKANEETKAQ